MLTSRLIISVRTIIGAIVLAASLVVAVPVLLPASVGGAASAAARSRFVSADVALAQGLAAYKQGLTDLAIDALEAASEGTGRTGFAGNYYLARVLADNGHRLTNHGRAYQIYLTIVDDNTDIDPEEDGRAPFVARALAALAAYTKNGVPEIGLKPNPQRAAQFIHQAATVFSDEDAQFELAKLFLSGDGIDPDVRRAIHWFSVLSQRGHPGAQAYLADLYWRGKFVPQDQRKALILITLALEIAPMSERIWMEDIHQNVFCGTSDGMRREATGVVADWRQKYGRAADEHSTVGLPMARPQRTCSDGRKVPLVARKAELVVDTPAIVSSLRPVTVEPGAAGAVDPLQPTTNRLLDVNGRAKGQ